MTTNIISITPAEAYQKVCCNDLFNNCKGPTCMAWRKDLTVTAPHEENIETHLGYCGLVD